MTDDIIKEKILEKFSRRTDDLRMTLMSPFVACKSKKTLFFHIAKTGGSAIHKILREKGLDDGILSQKHGHYEQKLDYFKEIVEHWDEYYKFTMVRNKYSQLVSNWNYDKKHLKFNGIDPIDPINHFRTFIKKVVKDDKECYGYWIDQYYLTTMDGKEIFDFIGRHENFSNDLEIIMQKIGIKKFDKESRVNTVQYQKRIPIREYYDTECRNIICQKFKDEIDHFGFKLDIS